MKFVFDVVKIYDTKIYFCFWHKVVYLIGDLEDILLLSILYELKTNYFNWILIDFNRKKWHRNDFKGDREVKACNIIN